MRKFPYVPLAPLLLMTAVAAHAELGGSVSRFPTGQTHAQAAIQPTMRAQAVAETGTTPPYQLHELTTETGVAIREYADSSGTVFAVSWDGPVKPDLQALLGQHFQRFLAAAAQPGGGPIQVDSPELVVFSGGRPRAFFGRAYLPAAVPAGVNIDVLP